VGSGALLLLLVLLLLLLLLLLLRRRRRPIFSARSHSYRARHERRALRCRACRAAANTAGQLALTQPPQPTPASAMALPQHCGQEARTEQLLSQHVSAPPSGTGGTMSAKQTRGNHQATSKTTAICPARTEKRSDREIEKTACIEVKLIDIQDSGFRVHRVQSPGVKSPSPEIREIRFYFCELSAVCAACEKNAKCCVFLKLFLASSLLCVVCCR
jgi:hypothetical protein